MSADEPHGTLTRTERDAVLADLGQLLEVLGLGDFARPESPHEVFQMCLRKLAEHENAITWDTTCLACAAVLDSSIKEHDRAERAEAKLAAIVAYCRERAEEISDRMLRVRPEDIRIDAGDILAIISAPDGP